MYVAGAPIWLYFILRLVELGIMITMTVLWLREMHRSMDACHPVSRKMEGGLVWLTFIPLFGFVWQFICSKRVGDSIAREYQRRNWSNEEECPGHEQGLVASITVCAIFVLRIFFSNQIHPGLFFIGTVAIGFCMFRHFDRLKAYRERLEKEIDPSLAFGQIPLFPNQQYPVNPQWQYPPMPFQQQYPPQYPPAPQYPPQYHQYPPSYVPVPQYQQPPPQYPPSPFPPSPPADDHDRWRPKDDPFAQPDQNQTPPAR